MRHAVKVEADNIKKHATQEEINRLEFGILDPKNSKLCIYGQMTGSCFSDRANELVQSCASECHEQYNFEHVPIDAIDTKGIDWFITPDGVRKTYRHYFSAIEFEIVNNPDGNEELINYIKA